MAGRNFNKSEQVAKINYLVVFSTVVATWGHRRQSKTRIAPFTLTSIAGKLALSSPHFTSSTVKNT